MRDAHEVYAVNLNLETLHPKANLIQGWGGNLNMLTGLDNTFKGVFLVGYHGGGQNNKAVLGHTMSSIIHYVKLNGKIINETGIAALYAGYYDVPIVFISGDDQAVSEAQEQLGNVVGVVVKKSLARDSVISLSLVQAKDLLEKNASEAVTKITQNEFKAFKQKLPITLEIGFYNTGFRISKFQHFYEVLKFDATYKFNFDSLAVTFESKSALEALQRLNMLMFLLFGISSD